jgi:alkylation response protein AidB-like acyl-CoA dehydrogenase
MLARGAERALLYDQENRFFTEDFEELRQAGYLRMNVPEALGGMEMSLAQVCQEQRRLAYHHCRGAADDGEVVPGHLDALIVYPSLSLLLGQYHAPEKYG